PRMTYTSWLTAPPLEPRSPPARKTDRVARLIGTGVKGSGIDIMEHTAVSAANKAQRIIFFVFK
ncbi:MAG TPA: hypothetical protein VM577_01225, partial [Anaerovoracaceae bacterium]|nr:hypothetical protein [Anaerovoracaceae bacterium]